MQGRPAYVQASRSPHPLTSGGSEGAAAVLADWRMNPGSDQDLTRYNNAVSSNGAAAASAMPERGDGAGAAALAAAAVHALSGSGGRSLQAALMQFDTAGGAWKPNEP